MNISFKANPINKAQARLITRTLEKAKSLDIVCHSSADEDTIACAKALQWLAQKMNINARIISDNINKLYEFKAHNINYIDLSTEDLPNTTPDTLLCVDFSSFSRVNNNIKNYIQKAKNIICIDHHTDGDIRQDLKPITHILSKDELAKQEAKKIYIDTTAKSCSAIIFRLFETLNLTVDKHIQNSLFCGMTDDLRKNSYLEYNETLTPKMTSKMLNDTVTFDLYKKLKSSITQKEQDKIIKHLNVLASLNEEQKAFQKRLNNSVKFNKNGRFGYIIIPQEDKDWIKLGGDNPITSSILGKFRIDSLKKYPELDTIGVFYPDDNGYRVSLHSKNNNVINLINHIKQTANKDFRGGGHKERGGGSIQTFDRNKSKKWAENFIMGAEEFFKS